MCGVLDRAVERTGSAPKYTVTDQGSQFRTEYRGWCKRHGVKPRFGAIGKHGSIAVTERAIRSIKDEGIRPTNVPLGLAAMCRLVALYACWYNTWRPHTSLGGAAPVEIYLGRTPAHEKPRIEPRARYPVKPGERLRARRGAKCCSRSDTSTARSICRSSPSRRRDGPRRQAIASLPKAATWHRSIHCASRASRSRAACRSRRAMFICDDLRKSVLSHRSLEFPREKVAGPVQPPSLLPSPRNSLLVRGSSPFEGIACERRM
jgi:hypothetical protein